MKGNIADLRKHYSQKALVESEMALEPFAQFEKWWDEGQAAGIDEANAMTLATASMDGIPSARIVLMKGFNEKGFVFFTNYDSYKGRQLSENPKACLVFFWKELERQVRITGLVVKINTDDSNAYFKSRPAESRIGAIISPQSQVIENREWLDNKFNEMEKKLQGASVQRPENWGGYIVKPVSIEFWQGRPSRLHDRIHYSLEESGTWMMERLAP